jgi:hypothetical protein
MARQAAQPQTPGVGTRGRGTRLGVELYLWILVAAELAVTAILRKRFRSSHGG